MNASSTHTIDVSAIIADPALFANLSALPAEDVLPRKVKRAAYGRPSVNDPDAFRTRVDVMLAQVRAGNVVHVDDDAVSTIKRGRTPKPDAIAREGERAGYATVASVYLAIIRENKLDLAAGKTPTFVVAPVDEDGHATANFLAGYLNDRGQIVQPHPTMGNNADGSGIGCNALGRGGRFAVMSAEVYAAVREAQAQARADAESKKK